MKKVFCYAVVALFSVLCSLVADEDQTTALLKKLTEAHGASGFEGPVRDILKKEWGAILSDLHADGMGNLIGSMPSSTNRPKVLIMAHMDEVGFLVRRISDDGFISMQAVGDWINPVVPAQRWVIMTPQGMVRGYSGVESIHAISEDTELATPKQKEIFIDVGAHSKAEVLRMGIRPGLPITPEGNFVVLNGTKRYMGKALDDRALLAVMTECFSQLQKEELEVQVMACATVQEEVGMRGAEIIFEQTKPDIVINLDVGIARDFPLYFSKDKGEPEPLLGGGPTLFVFDWNMIPNNKLVEYIMAIANKQGIPLQLELEDNYEQDGCNLQRSSKGIPVVNLGLPVRYAHSQAGIMDRSDYDLMVQLIVAIIQGLSPQTIKEMG